MGKGMPYQVHSSQGMSDIPGTTVGDAGAAAFLKGDDGNDKLVIKFKKRSKASMT